MKSLFDLIIKYSLYGLVFLMPLFFLPLTGEVFEFNKQYLLFFLTAICFLAWLGRMVLVNKKLIFYRTPLDVWILALGAVMVVSAIFSLDAVNSWLGSYEKFYDSVIVLLALFVFYFLAVNHIGINKKEKDNLPKGEFMGLGKGEDEKKKKGSTISFLSAINVFLLSSFLVLVNAYFSVFGIWAKISGLPQFMKVRSFSTINGSLEGLAVFISAVLSLLVGIMLQGIKRKKAANIFYAVFSLAALFFLVIVDFLAAWIILGLTMFVLLVLAFWTRLFKERVNVLLLPIGFLLLAGIFSADLPTKFGIIEEGSAFLTRPLPEEIILDHSTSMSVSLSALKEYPFLGSGPGTYLADFSKFKPLEFNEGNLWNVRFDRPNSYLLELVAVSGILGIASYSLMAIVLILVVLASLRRLKKWQAGVNSAGDQASSLSSGEANNFSSLMMAAFSGWTALFIGQLFYPGSIVLLFSFWFFTALVMVGWRRAQGAASSKMSFTFKEMPEVGLVMSVILLVFVFGAVGIFYVAGRFYVADVSFAKEVKTSREVVKKIEKTVNLNKYRSRYRRILSQAYLATAWEEANKKEAKRDANLLKALASGSVAQAKEATEISPSMVANWENLGVIYRDSRGLAGGTIPFAVDAFGRAVELEPHNPFFYHELCRLSILDEKSEWEKTVSYCQKAVELKENYLDARIQLALAYEKKGDLETAVNQMEAVLKRLRGVSFERESALASAATEIYFQLGRFYYNMGRSKDAIKTLEQAVIITPQYVNARYALAMAYQSAERHKDALVQLEIIDQVVPNNKNVQSMMDQIRSVIGGRGESSEGEAEEEGSEE